MAHKSRSSSLSLLLSAPRRIAASPFSLVSAMALALIGCSGGGGDSSGTWTWVSGMPPQAVAGAYGTQGVPSPTNAPGARLAAVRWTDLLGRHWVFGGRGYDAAGRAGVLGDLWRFDGTNWTWVSGSQSCNQRGVYGIQGVPQTGNAPGARDMSVSWTDLQGHFWLFGGRGYDRAGTYGYLNDLWSFDGSVWTWVSGGNVINQPGVYGSKGVASSDNTPGARATAVSWTDALGQLWLFGGACADWAGELNDLWRFDGTQWTWVTGSDAVGQVGVYGIQGVGDPGNVPGARRYSVSWVDGQGNFWLFGGEGFSGNSLYGGLNDLWRFDGATWTWISGSDAVNALGHYGVQGVAAPENVPGARCNAVSWVDAVGDLWLLGGSVWDSGQHNDLWRFDGTTWTWVSGSNSGGQAGVYGTQGVASSGNVPGVRDLALAWADAQGNLWLFGGGGLDGAGCWDFLGDLWRFDGSHWTWIHGRDRSPFLASFGTRGLPDPANTPGGRSGAVSWSDGPTGFLLFGGLGLAASGSSGYLSDLWRFDGSDWTWISGGDSTEQPGVYGVQGVPGSNNTPGGRSNAVSWTRGHGDLWLFGGEGYGGAWPSFGILNDLWRFDGTDWTWVAGSDSLNQLGQYGTKGIAQPGNAPGARRDSVSWTDSNGDLWLFGGRGLDAAGSAGGAQ